MVIDLYGDHLCLDVQPAGNFSTASVLVYTPSGWMDCLAIYLYPCGWEYRHGVEHLRLDTEQAIHCGRWSAGTGLATCFPVHIYCVCTLYFRAAADWNCQWRQYLAGRINSAKRTRLWCLLLRDHLW